MMLKLLLLNLKKLALKWKLNKFNFLINQYYGFKGTPNIRQFYCLMVGCFLFQDMLRCLSNFYV